MLVILIMAEVMAIFGRRCRGRIVSGGHDGGVPEPFASLSISKFGVGLSGRFPAHGLEKASECDTDKVGQDYYEEFKVRTLLAVGNIVLAGRIAFRSAESGRGRGARAPASMGLNGDGGDQIARGARLWTAWRERVKHSRGLEQEIRIYLVACAFAVQREFTLSAFGSENTYLKPPANPKTEICHHHWLGPPFSSHRGRNLSRLFQFPPQRRWRER